VWKIVLLIFLILGNLLALIMGILMNPGVAQSVIDYKLKERMGKSEEGEDETCVYEEDDIE